MVRMAAIAGLIVSAATAAAAQDVAPAAAPPIEAPAAPEIDPAQQGDVVIARGRRMSEVGPELEDYVSEFVGQIAAPPPGAGYARWQRRVCVGVYNLEADPAQYIVDRVSQAAMDVGLDPGDPGCNPDVLVVFTLDGKAMASHMVETQPLMFRPVGGEGGVQLGFDALDRFASSDRAIRWWHVSMPTDPRTGQPAIRLPIGDGAPPVLTDGGGGGSRIYRQLRDDLMYALIIVDATKLTEVTWEEIGDYIAFVSLAQIDPDAAPEAFDSILNLFANPTAYSGLTDWDRNYLRALYSFDQQRQPRVQTVELINEMARREEDAGAE